MSDFLSISRAGLAAKPQLFHRDVGLPGEDFTIEFGTPRRKDREDLGLKCMSAAPASGTADSTPTLDVRTQIIELFNDLCDTPGATWDDDKALDGLKKEFKEYYGPLGRLFGISLDFTEVANLKTFGSLLRLVEKKVAAGVESRGPQAALRAGI